MNELKELKAEAYDCLANIEYWQKRLNELNQKIAQINQEIQKKQSEESK